MALKLLTKTVTAAGTPEAFSSTSLRVLEFHVQVQDDNTGDMAIGDSTVDLSAHKGLVLQDPATDITISILSFASIDYREPFDLKEWYVDSAVNGDGINILYLEAVP